jgi:hypothetical protein
MRLLPRLLLVNLLAAIVLGSAVAIAQRTADQSVYLPVAPARTAAPIDHHRNSHHILASPTPGAVMYPMWDINPAAWATPDAWVETTP